MGEKLNVNTWYPHFDVLRQQEEWDRHTREVVLDRILPARDCKWLQEHEVELLKVLAEQIVHDGREETLKFVVQHFDAEMASDIGEAQRKEGIPKGKELVRNGFRDLEKAAKEMHYRTILQLQPGERSGLLKQLEAGQLQLEHGWSDKHQKAFFQKLLTTVVAAYYSHPTVWSEIGYAGPAYPRGYYRTEYGLTDPWEAKRRDS